MTLTTPQVLAEYPLESLAHRIEGASVLGNAPLLVSGLVHPALVKMPSHMAYIASEGAWQALLGGAKLGLVEESLAIPDAVQAKIDASEIGLLVVPRSRVALAVLLDVFERRAVLDEGIHPQAFVHPTAQLGEDVRIGAFASVGENSVLEDGVQIYPNVTVGADVQIGAGSILYAGVRIGDRCELGKRCILQPNAVIGADGFSYVTPKEARHEKKSSNTEEGFDAILRINSIGNVVLEDDVEVGACTCIDRGTLAETRIGKGTKLDNLTQIGHNNRIGEQCLIVSQVGIAGSCKIGNGVVIAGQVGVGDHLNIGDNAIVMACSAVMRDIDAGAIMLGSPALPHKEAMANIAAVMKLRDVIKGVKGMQAKFKDFEEKAAQIDALLALVPEEMKASLAGASE
ncbi:MAG: UDP-3-O-(3-hydroxymyristoyl)glucosamine N-acyltransferase [Vampirovibrionales bacterium]|jgi:UDP-3-O-[3-hydroxymyristoyl] glucosamine N-acyltransferase|nr:UDP-3-O-(3-hydroxymyristoyl)glucosamine N-acyltransferase [Vampirovibrionales bacterium]